MKAVRTVRRISIEQTDYTGNRKPEHKVGDYMRVYCGTNEGHNFTIKDIRFNHDIGQFEYLYGGVFATWHSEKSIVPASDRRGWHYDSQGYCDNPGRGY